MANGVPGGWRIWNKKAKKWWGQLYATQPDDLVEELNGLKRPAVITKLTSKYQKAKR